MGQVKVNVEDMVGSALHVGGQGEDLATNHFQSHGRIDAAQTGWVGRSATSMAVRAGRWQQASATLLARVSDHSQAMHTAAIEYGTSEEDRAALLRAVHPTPSSE